MADKKKMSVAEILAAARKADGDGASEDEPEVAAASEEEVVEQSDQATSSSEESPSEESGAEAPPQPAGNIPKSGAGRPSVAEMLAMARGAKSGGSQAAAKEKPKSPPKAKPAAGKTSPKPAAKKKTGPMDTTSILAAARSAKKPGPISKAEAEARDQSAAKKVAKEKPVAPPMPKKPSYATPKVKQKEPDLDRRVTMMLVLFGSFLALGFTAMTATFSLWLLGLARFMFPNILREPPSQFTVGSPGDYAPGQVETKYKAQYGVWVVNTEYQGEQQLFALQSICTHLGCTPNWLEAEQKFKCPCHGSGFYKDGINFEGPAPRPLERYAIEIDDAGQVRIDKSRTFQEEMGQWDDTASYVSV